MEDDLTRIRGIGENKSSKLKSAGYSCIGDIAGSTPEQLSSVHGIGEDTAEDYIRQAKVISQSHLPSSIEDIDTEETVLDAHIADWAGISTEDIDTTETPVADINGIGKQRKKRLNEAGIHSAEELAAIDAEDLALLQGISQDQASKYIERANQCLKAPSDGKSDKANESDQNSGESSQNLSEKNTHKEESDQNSDESSRNLSEKNTHKEESKSASLSEVYPSYIRGLGFVTAPILIIPFWATFLGLHGILTVSDGIGSVNFFSIETYLLFTGAAILASSISTLWYYADVPDQVATVLPHKYKTVTRAALGSFIIVILLTSISVAGGVFIFALANYWITATVESAIFVIGYITIYLSTLFIPGGAVRSEIKEYLSTYRRLQERHSRLLNRFNNHTENSEQEIDSSLEQYDPLDYQSTSEAVDVLNEFESEVQRIEKPLLLQQRREKLQEKIDIKSEVKEQGLDIGPAVEMPSWEFDDFPDDLDQLEKLESELDEVEAQLDKWDPVLNQYNQAFNKQVELQRQAKEAEIDTSIIPDAPSFEEVHSTEKASEVLEDWNSALSQWESILEEYDQTLNKQVELQRQVKETDIDASMIPDAPSFEEVHSTEKASEVLEDWNSALSQWESILEEYGQTLNKQVELQRQVKETDIDASIVPDVPISEEIYSTEKALKALEDWKSKVEAVEEFIIIYQKSREKQEDVEQQKANLDGLTGYCITDFPEVNPKSDVSSANDKLKEHLSELYHWEKRLRPAEDILALRSEVAELNETYPEYPFGSLSEELDKLLEELIEGETSIAEVKNEYENANDTIELTVKIVQSLRKMNTDHPSIYRKEWTEAIETALNNNFPNVLKPIVSDIESMEDNLWEHSDLFTYDWQEFEELISSLYNSKGYQTEMTPQTGDAGIDLWAKNDDETVAIQVKQYQSGNTVGRPVIQKTVSAIAKGDADKSVIVTSSSFSSGAERYAQEFGDGVSLIDKEKLIDQLSKSDVPPPA